MRPDVNIVILSVGSDDKVEEGHEFTVYRGEHFVARVQVSKVTSDMAGARVLFVEQGQEIRVRPHT